jgi:hypothetical protein
MSLKHGQNQLSTSLKFMVMDQEKKHNNFIEDEPKMFRKQNSIKDLKLKKLLNFKLRCTNLKSKELDPNSESSNIKPN